MSRMNPIQLLCPLAAVSGAIDDKEERVYGASQNAAGQGVVVAVALIWIISVLLAIVGMVKAFSCGGTPTNMGLTGTGWGAIILVLGILVTPVGGLLGIIFAIGGRCAGGLPMQLY